MNLSLQALTPAIAVSTIAVLTIAMAGCASYTDETKAIRSEFIQGDYSASLANIDKSILKTSSSSKLLY